MKTRVQKLGDGLALPLPSAITDQTGLTADAEVEVSCENGAVVVRPVSRPWHRLDELLAGVSDDNHHGEMDTGTAVSKEAW